MSSSLAMFTWIAESVNDAVTYVVHSVDAFADRVSEECDGTATLKDRDVVTITADSKMSSAAHEKVSDFNWAETCGQVTKAIGDKEGDVYLDPVGEPDREPSAAGSPSKEVPAENRWPKTQPSRGTKQQSKTVEEEMTDQHSRASTQPESADISGLLTRRSTKLYYIPLESFATLRGRSLSIYGEFREGRRRLLVDVSLNETYRFESTGGLRWRLQAPRGSKYREQLDFEFEASNEEEAIAWRRSLEWATGPASLSFTSVESMGVDATSCDSTRGVEAVPAL
mmetsp:Transcript_216/g.482  ORF Transcript_216/g.482 Transcript_216/m.482 type:complete len:282 (-) Transcript_216:229-1074(-)|eukprot:CAMPEP_0206514786 /NCGR_PEP_ID=MMETSP0324_2-20121206/62352_1 /ASSEMBLY_ACC=CAM_ASM_000836 /TAXON_ID=2866 /ORGANISM="Crypthecodinium cohnii, Strain Seligo" /LENGTH=281 /DNA_ID=CAMNT_0054007341 /DNA_START=140 /DNA_END=985 /DNA_ORIENTATION=+